MPPALAIPGQCAFCAFRKTPWNNPHILGVAVSVCGSSRSTHDLPRFARDLARRVVSVARDPEAKDKGGKETISRFSRHPGRLNNRRGPPHTPLQVEVGRTSYRLQTGETLRDGLSYSVLYQLIAEQFTLYIHKLEHSRSRPRELEALGIQSVQELHIWEDKFLNTLKAQSQDAAAGDQSKSPLFNKIRRAFIKSEVRGVHSALQYAFTSFVLNSGFTNDDVQNQKDLADLRYPLEWFPATRGLQRKIHLHVGPTNSGKTYQALKRLESAKSGIYAGPLRLLAHEVYQRLNSKGKSCSLITGEERRIPEEQEHFMSSCTVEMVPLNVDVDVAVIDEIQMMGDAERGWAWTQAFLGIKAKEIHLCGELRTVPLIKDLCAQMGDELEIHTYERLSPLKTMDRSLRGNLQRLEKGDAVIVFSRLGIHSMKTEIEKRTGRRCAVVYGSLPPETRAQQAALFNDPDNEYDILVASDAVGMGLNLSIKRIIFESTAKHDGTGFRVINTSDLKQIAGRAGRFRTAAQDIQAGPAPASTAAKDSTSQDTILAGEALKPIPGKGQAQQTAGLVTALEDFDMPFVKRAMSTDAAPIKSAGIFPPATVLARFAAYFPSTTPFSYILMRLHEICTLHPRFHLCRYKEQIEVADVIHPYNLTVSDRIIFIAAPVNLRDEGMGKVVKCFAEAIAEQTGGDILEMKEVNIELLDEDNNSKGYLKAIEALHKAVTLYLWLSYRFAGAFKSQALAFHIKSLVEERIDQCLAGMTTHEHHKKMLSVLRQRAVEDKMKEMGPSADARAGTVDNERGAVSSARARLPLRWEDGEGEVPLLDMPEQAQHKIAAHV